MTPNPARVTVTGPYHVTGLQPECQRTLALYKPGVPMNTMCTFSYTGRVPCTGVLRCTMCGRRKDA